MNQVIPVGRFAPSPTGPLHMGSLVAAVASYVIAKRGGGRWLLRMEDLDTFRVKQSHASEILKSLELLGLEWDGVVMFQSQRNEAYQSALDRLLMDGNVYLCGCSRKEIAHSATAPHDGEGETAYPGTCRSGLSHGKKPKAYRVVVRDQSVTFVDMVMGEQFYDLAKVCGDFVVKRADGLFAYQLAVVVDDAEQGVNQVVRGCDLLSSTPRQIHLQRLLNYATPEYFHLPLVTGPGGCKLSKRDNSVSLSEGGNLQMRSSKLLIAALEFLDQNPPCQLFSAPPSEILQWAVGHFDLGAIHRIPAQ